MFIFWRVDQIFVSSYVKIQGIPWSEVGHFFENNDFINILIINDWVIIHSINQPPQTSLILFLRKLSAKKLMYVTSPIFSRFGQVFQNFWKSRSFSYMCCSPWYSQYLSLIAFGSLCKESKEFDMPKWRNSVQFESQIFGLDFRGEGVNMVKIWFRAFRNYRLWSLRKFNRISVCSFRSWDIRIWKTGPKFLIAIWRTVQSDWSIPF